MPAPDRAQTPVPRAALAAAVRAEQEWMEALLHELVAVPSLLGQEEPAQVIVARSLRELGLVPVDVPMDADVLRTHPLAAPFSWDVEEKRNVVAVWPGVGEGSRSLGLNAHVDVIPPAAERLWSRSPFEPWRDGEWLVGRGSGDMKGGLVAMLGAIRALRALDLAPLGDVQLHSVVEEECGGNGALQCALAGYLPDAVVIPEPFPGAISVSQVGVLWFQVELEGVPAHVGEAEDGVNAIEAAIPVIERLRRLEAELNESPPPPYDEIPHPINLNVGVVRGGDWPSTVPASCTLSCRLALFPGEEVDALRRRIEHAVADVAREHAWLRENPPRVVYDGFAGEGVEVPSDAPIVEALAAAHAEVTGRSPALVPTTATTDARAYVASGIPAVCLGPLAESIHGIDERVHVPSILTTAETLAVLVRDWCGVTS